MDDKAILELFAQRDETALREFEQKYGGLCRRVASNILASTQDVEECLNDMYAALWRSIPPAAPQSLSAYACGVTRNLAHKRYEYNTASRRCTQFDISLDELAECLPDGEEDSSHLGELLNSFLETLTPQARRVFVRRYWLSDSIADVARDCRMSQPAVRSMLHRVRRQLKKFLEGEGISV